MIHCNSNVLIHMETADAIPGKIRNFDQCSQHLELRGSGGEDDADRSLFFPAQSFKFLSGGLRRCESRSLASWMDLDLQIFYFEAFHIDAWLLHAIPFALKGEQIARC